MRIAVISPVWFAVPPPGYGGIELVVSLLADGLADAGHDVTLFASGDSRSKASSSPCTNRAERRDRHHGGRVPARVQLLHAGGRVRCDQRPLGPVHVDARGRREDARGAHRARAARRASGEIYSQIAMIVPQLGLISISENQRSPQPNLPWLATVPNAIDLSLYPAKPHRGDYLLFLGRMSPDKGCHRAITVAIESACRSISPARSATRRSSSTSPTSSSRTSAITASSTWARCRTARRWSCSRTRARRCSRSSGRSRSAWS